MGSKASKPDAIAQVILDLEEDLPVVKLRTRNARARPKKPRLHVQDVIS